MGSHEGRRMGQVSASRVPGMRLGGLGSAEEKVKNQSLRLAMCYRFDRMLNSLASAKYRDEKQQQLYHLVHAGIPKVISDAAPDKEQGRIT